MAAVAKASDPKKMEVDVAEGATNSNVDEAMLEEEEEGVELGRDEEEEDDEEEEELTVRVGDTYSCRRQDGTYRDAEVVKTRMNKRAGREEFYVHFIGLNCRQNEWVDKSRLAQIKAVEEEEEEQVVEEDQDEHEDVASENETDHQTSKPGCSPQKQKIEEDEPESKKIKVEVHEASINSSIMASEELAKELTCQLCNELFKEPVVVECGHNFCRDCVDKAWEGQDSFTCPDCKEVITERRCASNKTLANLVKKTVGASAILTPAKNTMKEKAKAPENCFDHDERLKLFCKDDGDLGCVICRESLKHAHHNFLPILDAVGVYRAELSSIVSPLEEALKVTKQMAKEQSEKIEKHKDDMKEYREHIETEFENLHFFLREREEKLLEKLHEEGQSLMVEMEANVAKMQENINSIEESIATANEKLQDTDSISFLTDIKLFLKKCQKQKKEALSSGNNVVDKELNKETYKAPIQLSMLEDRKIAVAPRPMEIWIIGNFWVSQAARRRTYGKNLDLDEKEFTVRWMDKYSLLWRDLMPDVRRAASVLGDPNIVFIHLGSNDLGQRKFNQLLTNVKKDISQLSIQFPKTTFIWSPMMPRRSWLNASMDRQRKQFNANISHYVTAKWKYQVAELGEMEAMSYEILRMKGKPHLDEIADSFNKHIKDALEAAIGSIKEKSLMQP